MVRNKQWLLFRKCRFLLSRLIYGQIFARKTLRNSLLKRCKTTFSFSQLCNQASLWYTKTMKKLILTKGLQASGKTTWAKKTVDEGQGAFVNICKDDLRALLHNNAHSKGREALVITMQEVMTETALSEGKNVIWSDTNLDPRHEQRAREKFSGKAEIVIEDSFLQVSLEECIKRNQNRSNSVPESAIRDTYNRWIRKDEKPFILEQDYSLPHVILVDLDGTLAHMNGRGPFEWDRIDEDDLDQTIAEIVRVFSEKTQIIIVSGRDGSCRDKCLEWLGRHNIPFSRLYMRPIGDCRKDSIIKEEIFNHFIRGHCYVKFVLDDRNSVVDKWRELGLKCLQVAPGDF